MKPKKSLLELREEREKQEVVQRAFASFRRWWEPSSYDEHTGASIGGHPDAHRKWVRPDDHASGWYGEDALVAFKTQHYWQQFLDWKLAGEPPLTFTSAALPLEQQAVQGKILTDLHREMVRKMKLARLAQPRRGIVNSV